jgi:response regulator RpfG family c-di-GMP phosphodiesterase
MYSPLYNIGSLAIPNDSVVSIKSIRETIDYGLIILNNYIKDETELKVASNIVKSSFELYNGTGYPNSLVGNNIPIEAQITNIAVRIVKSNKSFSSVYKSITDTDSSKYNPDLIDVLKSIKKEIKEL